jgi:hypothetical protein
MEFDFSKNSAVQSLDGVPETYRGLYTEDADGGFKIADNAKGLVEAYTGVNKALKEQTGKNKSLQDEAVQRRLTTKAFKELAESLGLEGEDVAEVIKAHISELTEQVKGGKELKINLDKIKADHQKRLDEALGTERSNTDKMRQSLEKYLVGREAVAAIAAAKGSPELLLSIIKDKVKVVQDGEDFVARVVDDAGDIRSDGKGGFMTVADLVTEMKTLPAYARAFESETAGGTGKTAGSGQKKVSVDNRQELSAVDKIAAGLKKGQYARN